MKKLVGIGIITSIILVGCASNNITPQSNSVTELMKKDGITKVVGWEDYKKDSDHDKVPDYKDQCPNTPLNAPVDKNGCPLDSDKDGVPNYLDQCPNTPAGIKVDKTGCAVDSDKDGVADDKDKCPNTPAGVEVDKYGCGIDKDKDAVLDAYDKCPNTPLGAIIDKNGCAIDSDKDGVPNGLDKCPDTPAGVVVDKKGCPLDSDGDGVVDAIDKCPNTPKDVKVNFQGCPVIAEYRFNFAFNSYKIDKKYYPQIKKLVRTLKNNKAIKIEIQGYTDSKGSYLYNKELSLKRANALRELLIKKYHISPNRISIMGFGEDYPVASNKTAKGRAKNRRIIVIDKTNFIKLDK
jgi:outer membrane protein OmpA-like peptidoglycan-associated protein